MSLTLKKRRHAQKVKDDMIKNGHSFDRVAGRISAKMAEI
jgi:hypothetical protein